MGDMLFPPILRLPVRAIGSVLYSIFENVGCCGHSEDGQRQSSGFSNDNRMNSMNDNFNDLVLNLARRGTAGGTSGGTDSDSDAFTKQVMSNKYQTTDSN